MPLAKDKMMNLNVSKYLINGLLGILLISGSLLATDSSEQERIEVATRNVNVAERVAMYEKIAQEEQEGTELSKEMSLAKGETYVTSHDGAFHNPYLVSAFGDTVELEDGSIWAVRSSDKHKTLNWWTDDIVVITQNDAWFSSYDYAIVNITRGVEVKVNMLTGPFYNGIHTHWITAIDYSNNMLYLEDGSIWDIGGTWASYSDVLNTWLPNDTIIIGLNGDGNPVTPNILINVNTNTWAKATCIY